MSEYATTQDAFYDGIMQRGHLRTPHHAVRLTDALLHTMGFNLSGTTKRKLAKALPDDLARSLTRGWRLINIRNKHLTLDQFAKEVGLHSGNTDPQFAKIAIRAAFHQIKQMIDSDLIREVARDLSPEVRALWIEA